MIDIGKERSYQRNLGIKQAKGNYFLILDSDQSISSNLIHECVVYMHRGYSCVYIPEIIIAKSFFGKVRIFERWFYTGTAVDVPRFVKRDACPMFDEDMSGPEDADWGNRIPGKRTISKSVFYHNDDIGIIEYFKKKAYYSKSMKKFIDRNPNDKVLNPFYRCFLVFVENGKWKKLVMHPILTMCLICLITVRGIIYLCKK